MFNSLLFLFVNLAIFWTMYWAWQQDELEVHEASSEQEQMD